MNLQIGIVMKLELDPSEFNLISKALRGRIANEEIPDALELQTKMMTAKANQLRHIFTENEKLEKNLKDKVS